MAFGSARLWLLCGCLLGLATPTTASSGLPERIVSCPNTLGACSGHGYCLQRRSGRIVCQCMMPWAGPTCSACYPGYSGPKCRPNYSPAVMSPGQQSRIDYEQTEFPLEESWLMIIILISGIVFCLIHATMEGIYRRRAREEVVVDGTGSEIEAGYRPVLDEDMGSDPSSGDEETGLLHVPDQIRPPQITPPRPSLAEGEEEGEVVEAGDSPRLIATEDDDEDKGKCKICFEEPINSVLLDCGHSCACFECAKRLVICPFCRRKIKKVKKIFLMM